MLFPANQSGCSSKRNELEVTKCSEMHLYLSKSKSSAQCSNEITSSKITPMHFPVRDCSALTMSRGTLSQEAANPEDFLGASLISGPM